MSGVLLGEQTARQLLQLLDAPSPSRNLVPVKRRVDVSGQRQTVIGGRITVVHGTVDATYDVQPANGAEELIEITPMGRVIQPPTAHWTPAIVGDPCMLVVLPSLDGEATDYYLLAFTERLKTVDCNAG